jgi:hypothetical protein
LRRELHPQEGAGSPDKPDMCRSIKAFPLETAEVQGMHPTTFGLGFSAQDPGYAERLDVIRITVARVLGAHCAI